MSSPEQEAREQIDDQLDESGWIVQALGARAERAAEMRQLHREGALAVVDTVGHLLNRGYYIYGRYWDALHPGQTHFSLDSLRHAFELFKAEYEQRWYVDAARICTFFGSEHSEHFSEVARLFQHLDPRLRDSDPEYSESPDSLPSGASIIEFRNAVYELIVALSNAVPPLAGGQMPRRGDETPCEVPFS
jgi:hypothetical protein